MPSTALLLAVLATLIVGPSCTSAGDTIRVAFVGNSFTFVNDLPQRLSDVAASLGDKVITNRSVIGGCTLYAQTPSRDANTKALLEGDWDYIVLQDYSQLPTVEKARAEMHHPALGEFAKAKKQAKVVMYMTWGYYKGTTGPCPSSDNTQCFPLGSLQDLTDPPCTSNPHYHNTVGDFDCMAYALARGYLEDLNLGADMVAPCGLAWQVARGSESVPAGCSGLIDDEYKTKFPVKVPLAVPAHETTSDIMLYRDNGGDKHPDPAGQYLNALVFYSTLFGRSSLGAALPTDGNITAAQGKGLQQVASSVVLDYKSTWHMP